jgi:hypothetical protein
MGLFWGRLRRKRVFGFIPQQVEVSDGEHIKGVKVDSLHLLSDLSGVTLFQYEFPHDGEYKAAVSASCEDIVEIIEEEQFFFDRAKAFVSRSSVAKLLFEYNRQLPLALEAELPKKYHALSEGIRLSFLAPPFASYTVSHVTIFARQGGDGLAFVGENMGQGEGIRNEKK